MNTSLKKEITAACKAYMDAHNMSKKDFGDKTGLNSSLLTHIFRDNSNFTIPTGGKDTVIADKYLNKMANFIGLELTKSFWDIKATPQLTAILATLEDAKKHGTTAVIIGQTGAGKTHALRLFQRKNPMDTYITTVGSNDNVGDLIDRICEVLGLVSIGKAKSRKLRNIYSRLQELRESGHNPQLILDEAEYMKQPALSAIKEIYDHVNQHASLVLVGTQQLIDNIEQLRKKNRPGMPQFYRRVKFGIRTLPAVDRRYSLFIEGLDKEVVHYLQTICDNYGELHDVLVPVRREAERTEEEITVPFIKKVLNLR